MTQTPDEDDTPFSLPRDVPEIMPVDYPQLDSNVDLHEVYDEGLGDAVDSNPYVADDDPIKSIKRSMKAGIGSLPKLTTDHGTIRRWAEQRMGKPARTKDTEDGLDWGGLRIDFQNGEHDAEAEFISWGKFFEIFEKHRLTFLYKNKTKSGEESRFYKLITRLDTGFPSKARGKK